MISKKMSKNYIDKDFIREAIEDAKLIGATAVKREVPLEPKRREFADKVNKIEGYKLQFKESERIDEYEVARGRDGAYYDDEGNKLDSKSWKGGYAKKHVVSNHPQDRPNTTPHSVHINGKKWKTFGSKSHAQNVAKKIKGATVHMEEYNED